jgi:hypothetical protein
MQHLSIPYAPRSSRSRERGTSLLEAIAYLGVAATIIVGAVALLTNAFSNARANRAQEELAAIGTGVKRLFMSQAGASGTGSLNDQLASAKVFPSTLSIDPTTGTVLNAWNGAVTVTGNTATFQVSYAGLPQSVCIELVSTTSQWIDVAANAGTPVTPPVSLAQAAAACNVAEGNSIVWTGR